uniref:Uncharacterized protein n=1 Tax=Timema shepardi TaxID=629360 RepID=A0A7R9AR30_TIMSH|nr:unnamed protein product [Timema shepardi]
MISANSKVGSATCMTVSLWVKCVCLLCGLRRSRKSERLERGSMRSTRKELCLVSQQPHMPRTRLVEVIRATLALDFHTLQVITCQACITTITTPSPCSPIPWTTWGCIAQPLLRGASMRSPCELGLETVSGTKIATARSF